MNLLCSCCSSSFFISKRSITLSIVAWIRFHVMTSFITCLIYIFEMSPDFYSRVVVLQDWKMLSQDKTSCTHLIAGPGLETLMMRVTPQSAWSVAISATVPQVSALAFQPEGKTSMRTLYLHSVSTPTFLCCVEVEQKRSCSRASRVYILSYNFWVILIIHLE